MKILTAGHRYELANFEKKDERGQILQFIEKVPVHSQDCAAVAHQSGECDCGLKTLKTVNDGTTNEEVIKCLIDRMQSLYDKFPSEETACSIRHLKEALYAQQSRTLERQQRGVEGKHLK